VSYLIGSFLTSALIVSWAALYGALYFFIKILKALFGNVNRTDTLRGLGFFVFFPSGVFLIAVYTESLYALFSLAAVYIVITKRKFWPVIPLLYLTGLTHVTAPLVAVLLAMLLYEEGYGLVRAFLALAATAAGLATYMIYLQIHLHNALAFVKSQHQIHHWLNYSLSNINIGLNVFSIVLFLLAAVTAGYWWKQRRSFAVYSGLFLLIPILGGEFGGFQRYVLMDFPIYFMLFKYLREKIILSQTTTTVMIITWTYFALQYAGGYIGS
jgi:hypothetical protein